MRLDLLTQIADELEKFEDKPNLSFDMRYWIVKQFDSNHEPCGTVCCAVGVGIVKIPEFRQLLGPLVVERDNEVGLTFTGMGWNVAKALEMPDKDCDWLFQVEGYLQPEDPEETLVKKEDVIARIRGYVKSHS